jgi:HD superfamily phosphohydrolase
MDGVTNWRSDGAIRPWIERGPSGSKMTFQRLRDPVHDLIEFSDTKFERMIWQLLETPEFQRLRRIRQLGFSDLVFPGAVHSRFAHSVGVFHTARLLCGVIEEKLGSNFEPEAAETVICAALVHDLGHGPFSHAFESALDMRGKHEAWTEKIILSPDVSAIMDSYRRDMSADVAQIFKEETPPNIYSSVVSSQFDADRLDYMRRDRMMTGTQIGGIDFTWLLRNLEVCKIDVGVDDEKYAEIDTLVLGGKALWAGESYVLSLFQLYPNVYLHKTTRGAEQLFSHLMQQIKHLVDERSEDRTGLTADHPLLKYLKDQSLANYLDLDDTVIWGSLPLIAKATDSQLAQTADDLRYRRLPKACDVGRKLAGGHVGTDARKTAKFARLLSEARKANQSLEHRILGDRSSRNPYKRGSYDSPKAIQRIHILVDGHPVDLADESAVVRALMPFEVNRLYTRPDDNEARAIVEALVQEALN